MPRSTIRRAMALLGATIAVACLAGCSIPSFAPRETPPVSSEPVTAPQEITPENVAAWMQTTVPAVLERNAVAGASVAVVSDDEVLAASGFGASDLGGPDLLAGELQGSGEVTPVDADTLFRVGSVSKLFTATAVMQLVESGDLDLDTDIHQYLDGEIPLAFDEPVTLRHLLTHTAGFEDRQRGLIQMSPFQTTLRDEVFTDPPEQIWAPGTTPAYSNYSFTLAGYIVEHVSGVPFDDFVTANILQPAGMSTATFAQPSDVSLGYDTVTTPPIGYEYLSAHPPGSMSASANDMAAFMSAVLSNDGTLLEPETLTEMFEPALTEEQLGGLAAEQKVGLTWWLGSLNGNRIVSHGGDLRAFHSQLALFPDAGLGVYLSVNSTGNGGIYAAREEVVASFARQFLGSEESSAPQRTDTSEEHAAAAAGAYYLPRGSFSTFLKSTMAVANLPVTNNGDGTITIAGLTTLGGVPRNFEEVEATDTSWVWQEVGGETRIAMDVENGSVRAIGANSGGAYLPVPAEWGWMMPLVIVVFAATLVVLAAWPIGAIVRRRHGVSIRTWTRGRKTLRLLTHLGLVMTLVSSLAWTIVVGVISAYLTPPAGLILTSVALTWLAALGIIPAAMQVVTSIRHRAGFWSTATNILIVAVFAAFIWVSWMGNLLSTNISY